MLALPQNFEAVLKDRERDILQSGSAAARNANARIVSLLR
jgi:hypothetical protein